MFKELLSGLASAIGALILLCGTLGIVALILAYPCKWLWNWLLPTLFQFPLITADQALGLIILGGLLFGSNKSSSSKED